MLRSAGSDYGWLALGWLLLLLGLFGSCIAAPFLTPILQFFFLPPAVLAAGFGWLGARCERRAVTIGCTLAAVALFVLHDLLTNPFGYVIIYDTYVRQTPPPGLMYFHYWAHVYQVTMPPVALAVALLTQHLVTAARHERRLRLGLCMRCAYVLRGLRLPRCPECGEPFDPTRIEPPEPPPPN